MKYEIPEPKHKHCSTLQTNAFVNKACKRKRKYVVIDFWFVDLINKELINGFLSVYHINSIWCASVSDGKL